MVARRYDYRACSLRRGSRSNPARGTVLDGGSDGGGDTKSFRSNKSGNNGRHGVAGGRSLRLALLVTGSRGLSDGRLSGGTVLNNGGDVGDRNGSDCLRCAERSDTQSPSQMVIVVASVSALIARWALIGTATADWEVATADWEVMAEVSTSVMMVTKVETMVDTA